VVVVVVVVMFGSQEDPRIDVLQNSDVFLPFLFPSGGGV
jgi:hypothetical protein